MGRRAIAAVAAIAALGLLASVGLRPGPPAPAPALSGALIAHRAGLSEAPENSLQAIRSAAALGADGVELDVRAGPDGPVCAHDADQVPGAPSLGEALDQALELGLLVELDVKAGPLGSPRLVRQVVDEVAGRPGVWVTAFHPIAAWWVRRYDPALPLGWPVKGVPQLELWGWWLGASVLEPSEGLATPGRLARWLERGWAVEVWTVHDPERVRTLRASGAAVVVDAVGPHQP